MSILKQLGPEDELIVSDDGSTDETVFIVSAINDPRIICVVNKMQKGYTGNFENALSLAKGDFIFLSDQDDIWHELKVSLTLSALHQFDFVVTDALVVNDKLELIAPSYFKLRNAKFGFASSLIRCRYLGCCYAFNRKVLKKSLPFPENNAMLPHDLWLALVAELFFKVKYLKEPLTYYRRHESNVSSGGKVSGNSLGFKLKFRLYAIYSICKAIYAR